MQTYIVKNGDTLFGISKQYGISVDDIKRSNNLTNNNIVVGQVLKIPTSETSFTYIVKKGDTLYAIANKYNVSISEIMNTNNLTNSNLSIGDTLIIPIGSGNNDYSLYTVKVNDTLYSIAKKNNTSVDDIIRLNNLINTNLSIGQVLKIPITDNSNYYVVQSGDTLYSISRKTGVSVNRIMALNNLTDSSLSIGQVLLLEGDSDIMDSDSIPLGAVCYGSGYVETKYVTYTVKRGDNLYDIARRFGVSVDSIKALNDLNSNLINIGDVLKIKEDN